MAKTKDKDPVVEGTEERILGDQPDPVTSADSLERYDDRHPAVVGDAKLEDPPNRTTRPDVPVNERLAVGAGQHVPADPEQFTPEGRPRIPEGEVVSTAIASEEERDAADVKGDEQGDAA